MQSEVKIPKTPIKMIEVRPGMWVADPNQKVVYYSFFEVPEIFKTERDRKMDQE